MAVSGSALKEMLKAYMNDTKRFSDESGDEHMKLVQKGVHLEPLTRPVHSDSVPANGSEYIYIQRLSDANLKHSHERSEVEEEDSTLPKAKDSLIYWRRRRAAQFKKLVSKLNANKEILKEKFPKKTQTPEKGEKEWCLFCQGFEMCSLIHDTQDLCSDILEGHPPDLSIVLHLTQEEVLLLLNYHLKWLKAGRMDDKICRWIFALFACLETPVNQESKKLLTKFLEVCKPYRLVCEESQRGRVNLMVAIAENYFLRRNTK